MKPKKGFTLVELMVVVAIIAILAAVALPMYSAFRMKAKVATIIKSCTGATSAMQAWYTVNGNFAGVNVEANGGTMKFDTSSAGSGLPYIENVEWSMSSPSSSVVRINWHFTASCPPASCDGYWELSCSLETEKCNVIVKLDDLNSLGMNIP